MTIDEVLEEARTARRLSADAALALADTEAGDQRPLMALAAALRDAGHGGLVSYSPKVFIPLTQLCRDVCHYCTFAHPPRHGEPVYLSAEEVLAIARAGAEAGCHEALFTLGDKPELRYAAAREALDRLGHETTLSYLAEMAGLVLRETGLLPHLNPGVMTRPDIEMLRKVSASQGIMLESASERLRRRGGPHFGSPDKDPAVRLDTIRDGRRGGGAVHVRHPDRHRRDPARAHRVAAGLARSPRPLRPYPGNHHPEFPGQAGHPHGGCARARSRRPSVDDCRRPAGLRPRNEHPGAAQI